MTAKEQLDQIATRRTYIRESVLAEPERFVVCEICESILMLPIRKSGLCLFCGGYRFDGTRERVLAAATALGDKPIAASCAVLPRFQSNLA
jgi:hypothetical protein